MLMSQPAMSSPVAARPGFGLAAAEAAAAATASPQAARRSALRVDMLHLALVGYAPGRDRVGMIDRPVAAIGNHLLAGGLHVSALIGRAALQDGGPAAPAPRHAKARQCL